MENRIKELELSAKASVDASDVAEELKKKLNEVERALELSKQESEERVSNLETALSLSEEARKSKVSELEDFLVTTEEENKNLKGELERAMERIQSEKIHAVSECKVLRDEVKRLQEELEAGQEALEEAVQKRDSGEKLLKFSEEGNLKLQLENQKLFEGLEVTGANKSRDSIVANVNEDIVEVIDKLETAESETQEKNGGGHYETELEDIDMKEENKEAKAHREAGSEILGNDAAKTVLKESKDNVVESSFELERIKTAQLERTIFNMEATMKQQSSKIQELRELLEKEQMKESSPEMQKLDSPKPDESDAEIRALQSEIEIQKQALAKTEVTVMTYLSKIEQLSEEVSTLKSSLDSSEGSVARLKSELETLTTALSDREYELENFSAVMTARETEIKELRSLLDEKAKVEDEANETSKLLQESKQQVINLERKIQILENVKSMVFRKNKEMQDKLSAAKETLRSVAGKENEKESSRENQLKSDLIDLKSQLENSEKTLKDKDSALVKQKHQMEQENKSLHLQLSSFSDKVHNLTLENKEVKSKKEHFENEVLRLREAMSSYSKNHAQELSSLANSKRDLENSKRDLEVKLKSLSASSATMVKDLSDILNGTVSVNALLTNASVDALQLMCPDLTVGERCSKSDELLGQILPNIKNGVMYKKSGTANRQIVQLGEVISEILSDKAKLGKRVNKLYFRFLVTEDDNKQSSSSSRRKGKSFRKSRP